MGADSYEEIKHYHKLMAIILRANYSNQKTLFFSSPEFSQQLGYIVHEKNEMIKPHFHKGIHRNIIITQEVLFIKRGKLMVSFYTTDKEFITSRELVCGDIIFLCSGGHGFRMLEDTEMVEVKQGPYSGRDSDKEIFDGVENDPGK
jgi:hypothetical protein